MKMKMLFAAVAACFSLQAGAQEITLHGAVQFPDEHVFTRTLVRFQELVSKYSGKKINWVLHKNSELGLEKQYFEYMAQGKAVDYAIVSPAHMSTFSKAAPFIDAPFLFRDLARHSTQEKYQLRLKYGVGDVVIWDNASLLHSATLTDPQDPRTLWRITVKEEGRP